jgi:hypothetical protein
MKVVVTDIVTVACGYVAGVELKVQSASVGTAVEGDTVGQSCSGDQQVT